jgi:hypothetical protein
MKKPLLILLFTLIVVSGMNAQITLSEPVMPFDPCNYYPVQASLTGFTVPTAGAGVTWNYGTLTSTANLTNSYLQAGSTAFPNASLKDTSLSSSIIPGRVYYYTGYYDETNGGFEYQGFEVKPQRYSISAVTGGPNDSAIFPAQTLVLPSPPLTLKYPLSMNGAWRTSYVEWVNFNLTLAMASLINTPSTKKTYVSRLDTVVGWGSMIVPTGSGPSQPGQVLMVKRTTITTDSFFIAGNPAPGSLLSAFGLAQGQQTISNRYLFWRKHAVYPMLLINFGSDNFTTPASVYYDGMAINAGLDEPEMQLTLYPNPAGDLVHLSLLSSDLIGCELRISDMSGRIVKQVRVLENPILLDISTLPKGTYIIGIGDASHSAKSVFIKE